jgi:putative lipoprotein (rSAM/lipoprotein system)
MKKIKYQCLKKYNTLIVSLISFLGFASSCDIIGGGAMYGTPSADFIVKGKIEATTTNTPIVGIKVEMSKERDSDNGKIVMGLDTTFSAGRDGAYIVNDKWAFPENQTYQIKFTDIDGTQNGEYETLDTTIVFQDPKFTDGDGHWYNGQVEKELNVKLRLKK